MTHDESPALGRRSLLRLALAGVTGVGLAACDTPSSSPTAEPSPTSNPSAPGRQRVLLAYFSRAGENYYNGGRRTLQVGNTQVVVKQSPEPLARARRTIEQRLAAIRL